MGGEQMKAFTQSCCWGALAIAGAAAGQAHAADAAPNSAVVAGESSGAEEVTGPGDIVVTALRRDQRLQEAPAAISVLTSATIEAAGVKNLDDVGKLVPSLRFEAGLRAGVPSISLRGISAVQGGDAPFSLLVDGVQVPFLELFNQDLLDISSIELLKGPQGALYGRGAIAGALLINTRAPDNELRGSLHLSAAEGADYRGSATISGPLVQDILAAKITAAYQNRRGLIHIRTLDRPGDYVDQATFKGQLRFTPGDNTTIDLFGTFIKGKSGWGMLAQIPVGVPGAIEDFHTYEANLNHLGVTKRTLWNVALKIDHKLDMGTITSVSQYAYGKSNNINDFDYTPVAQYVNYNPIVDKAFNQDLRFTSDFDGPFNFIIGAFYQRRTGDNDVNVLTDPAAVPALPPRLISYQDYKSEAYAGYGQVSLDLENGFSVVGALRYDVDKREDALEQDPTSFLSTSFKAWQPSATVKYQVSPRLMTYATFGRGFRSGGFNAANLTVPAIGAQRVYPKEMSTNYEAGFKSQFLDRKLTFNAALFLTDFDNAQFQQTIVVPVPARFITSIDKTRVKGAEADLSLSITPELVLSGSLSITDSKIRRFTPMPAYNGNQSPNVYKDNEQVSLEYRPDFNDTYRGLFRIDVSRRGRISYDLSENFTYKPVTFANVRMGIETAAWSLAVFGNNLTNQRAPTFFSALAFRTSSARLSNVPFNAGVDFTYRFGGH
jgi:iron complex outermembrane receptor protein